MEATAHLGNGATAEQPPTPQADTPSLAAALGGTFVLRCASYCAGTIIPISLGLKSHTDANVTANLAALVSVSFYAAELIGAPILGSLSDRFGRKPFMILGAISGGIAIQLLGFTAIIPILLLVRILEGLSTASSAPATLGFLSARTAGSERLRGRVMGLYEAATVVGLTSGAFIAGRMFEAYGALAFSFTAAIYALSLIIFLFIRDKPTPSAVKAEPFNPGHHFGGLFRRMLNPRIMRFAPAWLAANAYLGAWLNVAPFLASATPDSSQYLMQGFRPREIGDGILALGVLFTVGAVGWGFIMPHIGRQATLLAGVLGMGFSVLMIWLLNHHTPEPGSHVAVPVLVALIAAGIVVESGFTPAALSYLAEIAEAHAEDRGSVMGVYSVLLSVGNLAGAGLAGPMAAYWGMNGLIVLSALLCVVAAATVLLLGRVERKERRLAMAGLTRVGPAA